MVESSKFGIRDRMLSGNSRSRKSSRFVLLALALSAIFAGMFSTVNGSVYYSMSAASYATVKPPEVVLQNGTDGVSTIYANGTSAKVSVSGIPEKDFNCVLNVSNLVSESWKIRLKAYSNSSINRLTNCTIYFHNETDGVSSQIKIINGEYNQSEGDWYDLLNNETVFIAMHIKADPGETAYVYAYLEILVPNTSTYARYVITFEIT
jgi:hypothetical protein